MNKQNMRVWASEHPYSIIGDYTQENGVFCQQEVFYNNVAAEHYLHVLYE
jgi:hypothetical protein